jgi:hypothetical protein
MKIGKNRWEQKYKMTINLKDSDLDQITIRVKKILKDRCLSIKKIKVPDLENLHKITKFLNRIQNQKDRELLLKKI